MRRRRKDKGGWGCTESAVRRCRWGKKANMRAVRTSHVLLVLVVSFGLGIFGCLKLPLGNSETSKMDPQFVGLWINTEKDGEDSQLYAVIPFDARSYLLTQMIFRKDGATI